MAVDCCVFKFLRVVRAAPTYQVHCGLEQKLGTAKINEIKNTGLSSLHWVVVQMVFADSGFPLCY